MCIHKSVVRTGWDVFGAHCIYFITNPIFFYDDIAKGESRYLFIIFMK
jgi:hypothetical protein